MDRINRIWQNETYQSCLEEIRRLEKGRIFCGHTVAHFLDVARLAYIIDLTEGFGIDREQVYAAALLHDIGRHLQYQGKEAHEQAGARIAAEILKACGFSEAERKEITEAILRHRDAGVREERTLAALLYRADKLSRACYCCPAEAKCNRSWEKKNRSILY